ncbi:hypothetical protein JW906_01010 [bacterium]|nr:hypothetical protein [bacterium]
MHAQPEDIVASTGQCEFSATPLPPGSGDIPEQSPSLKGIEKTTDNPLAPVHIPGKLWKDPFFNSSASVFPTACFGMGGRVSMSLS